MARSAFRLARLLDLRVQEERAARRELAARIAAEQALRAALVRLASSLERCEAEAPVAPLAGALAAGLRRRQAALSAEIARAGQQVAAASAAWQETRTRVRALAVLEERHERGRRRDAARAEQQRLVELALGRPAPRRAP